MNAPSLFRNVAALYVAQGGCYFNLPNVDPWDEDRDARRYAGPYPVVAHPPCQRWGKLWAGQPEQPSVAEAARVRSQAIQEFCASVGMKASDIVKHLPEDVRRIRAQAALDAKKAALRTLTQESE